MDDECNRDKLVKRYAELYDVSDSVSLALEKSFSSQFSEDEIEEKASQLLQDIVKVCMKGWMVYFERFENELLLSLL